MLSIVRKVRGLTCRDVYFYDQSAASPVGEDVQYWVQSALPMPHSENFFTSLIDLEKDADEILGLVKKNVSYEIRRAEVKDAVTVTVIAAAEPTDVDRFSDFYDVFSESKGLAGANRAKLNALAKSGALVLSFAHVADRADLWLCAHAYITDGRRARLLYSASNPSLSANSDRQLVGRANRYMHWQMILHFKRGGFATYDFGGISKRADLKSVDEFKQSFGGREVVEFNSVQGVTVKGKLAVLAYRVACNADRAFKLLYKKK